MHHHDWRRNIFAIFCPDSMQEVLRRFVRLLTRFRRWSVTGNTTIRMEAPLSRNLCCWTVKAMEIIVKCWRKTQSVDSILKRLHNRFIDLITRIFIGCLRLMVWTRLDSGLSESYPKQNIEPVFQAVKIPTRALKTYFVVIIYTAVIIFPHKKNCFADCCRIAL